MSGQGSAAGVVRVRLSGDLADAEAVAAVIGGRLGMDVLERSAPRPNRYEPGVRIYLTLAARAAREVTR